MASGKEVFLNLLKAKSAVLSFENLVEASSQAKSQKLPAAQKKKRPLQDQTNSASPGEDGVPSTSEPARKQQRVSASSKLMMNSATKPKPKKQEEKEEAIAAPSRPPLEKEEPDSDGDSPSTSSDEEDEDEEGDEDRNLRQYISELAASKGLAMDASSTSIMESLLSNVMARVLEEAVKGNRGKSGAVAVSTAAGGGAGLRKKPVKKIRTEDSADEVLTSIHVMHAVAKVLPGEKPCVNPGVAKRAWKEDRASLRGVQLSRIAAEISPTAGALQGCPQGEPEEDGREESEQQITEPEQQITEAEQVEAPQPLPLPQLQPAIQWEREELTDSPGGSQGQDDSDLAI